MHSLYWLRQDLRVVDNPALRAAMASGPTVAVYLFDQADPWGPGGASRWWLHNSLQALAADLKKLNVPLVLRRTQNAAETLHTLAAELNATHVFWSRCYEPYAIQRDTHIKETLKAKGITVESYNAALLHEPWDIKNQSGSFYRVYTPFSKACFATPVAPGLPAPPAQKPISITLATDSLANWDLIPTTPDWAGGLQSSWQPGAAGAEKQLKTLLLDVLQHYGEQRDLPAISGTSRLSPHLHFGEISPRQIWHAVQHARAGNPAWDGGSEKYLKEILWREFSYHLLYHLPHMPEQSLDQRFKNFPWQEDATLLRAWQRGKTGYPIVDAGMRQLWQTGWMHNRVRMICASVLVKHFLQPWQAGAAWFWDTLVDADLASNSASWQWVAGCGADAAPYFRIFNPTLQGQKFDPDGTYIKRYVPELATVPKEYIHNPHESGLPLKYPKAVIEHAAGRARALDALATINPAKAELTAAKGKKK